MSDKGPNTAVSAILVVIVIFVALIVFFTLFSEQGSEIIDIFDEVFYGAQSAAEEAKQNTIEAQAALLGEIDRCKYDAAVNPHSANKCFCRFANPLGVISDQSYVSLQNKNNALTITAYNTNDAPLVEQQRSYELGLFVVKESDAGKEIGCIFPSQYLIKGVDEEGKETQWDPAEYNVNNWYIYWEDQRMDKWFWEKGKDYTFGFYADKLVIGDDDYKYYESLAAAPVLYKISDSKFCLLTDLIEFPMTDISGLQYDSVHVFEAYNPENAPGSPISFLPFILSDSGKEGAEDTAIRDFFTTNAQYCNSL